MELEQQLRAALTPRSSGSAVRAAVLARLSVTSTGRRGIPFRSFIVVGVLCAAAAAAVLMVNLPSPSRVADAAATQAQLEAPQESLVSQMQPVAPGQSTPPQSQFAAETPRPANFALASGIAKAQATAVSEARPIAAALVTQIPALHTEGLPLLLPTEFAPRHDPDKDQALRNAVERHPELVEGTPTEGTFFVAMMIRADGSVVSSAAQLAEPGKQMEVSAAIDQTLPTDLSGQTSRAEFGKGAELPNGRSLRAQVILKMVAVPDGYDMTRSSAIVDRLVRTRHRDLLLPASGAEQNRLTLLLTEDGQIAREKVERVRRGAPTDPASRLALEETVQRLASEAQTDPGAVMRQMGEMMAEHIANQLEIDAGQIGLIGQLSVREGFPTIVEGSDGFARRVDGGRVYSVTYAWPRRPGESGPSVAYDGTSATIVPARREFDRAAAVTVVERLIPDAFTLENSAGGMPIVVLNAKGEAIGAYRFGTEGDELVTSSAAMREMEQQVPGVNGQSVMLRSETLTNNYGDAATVTFAWVGVPPP